MSKSIKMYDGVEMEYNGILTRYEHFTELWKALGWDIDHNEQDSATATEIVRQLIMFGELDLTDFVVGGGTLVLRIF